MSLEKPIIWVIAPGYFSCPFSTCMQCAVNLYKSDSDFLKRASLAIYMH